MRLFTRLAVTGIGGALPMLLYSFSSGPPVRRTGAPGDQTCVVCHTGTALNGGGGNVALAASTGATYTPGQKVTFTITVTDSVARIYGFQATARPDSNASAGQAGNWTIGTQQRVRCEDGNDIPDSGCPASGPIQFIEHARPFNTNVITAEWTAPSTDVGPVTIYLAANAANGNGNNQGDHIYTTSLKLTPAAGAQMPTISSGGVVSASNFKTASAVTPGSWIEIFGSTLSSTTREWAGSDFNGSNAPTSLDGVSVTVGGKAAYVSFISPGQVNAQVPDGVAIGSGVPVVVKNAAGESAAVNVTVADAAPAILAPTSFSVGGKQFAVATFAGTSAVTYVGATGSIAGITLRPAKPGETVTLYAIGCGTTDPAVAAGTIVSGLANIRGNVAVQFGTTPATIQYAGLAPGFVGLYQLNVTVPNLPAGDYPLNVTNNGTPVAQNLFLTVGK
jgi:uncharacterized protein (TIGR03437 family)